MSAGIFALDLDGHGASLSPMVRAARSPVAGAGEVARGLGWGFFLAGFVPGLQQLQLGQRAHETQA